MIRWPHNFSISLFIPYHRCKSFPTGHSSSVRGNLLRRLLTFLLLDWILQLGSGRKELIDIWLLKRQLVSHTSFRWWGQKKYDKLGFRLQRVCCLSPSVKVTLIWSVTVIIIFAIWTSNEENPRLMSSAFWCCKWKIRLDRTCLVE